MSSTNRGAVRSANDFYATPIWAIEAIVPHLPPINTGVVLDPGCGTGNIAVVLKQHGYHVHGVEIDVGLAGVARTSGVGVTVGDFLDPVMTWDYRVMVFNPPFSLAREFVVHAIKNVGPNGHVFALLRLAFLEGQTRARFHRLYPSDVFVLPKRPSFTGGGTDSAAYGWFAWGPGRGNRWSILEVPS